MTDAFNPYTKRGSGRARPFRLWVVVGESLFTSVPKATLRKALNKRGRVQKVEFRRSMTSLQVQNRIMQAFPHLKLDKVTFMKCIDLNMVTVEVEGGGYPTGSVVQSIASKESLYLVDSSKPREVKLIFFEYECDVHFCSLARVRVPLRLPRYKF